MRERGRRDCVECEEKAVISPNCDKKIGLWTILLQNDGPSLAETVNNTPFLSRSLTD